MMIDWILLAVGIVIGIHLERWRARRADRATEKSKASFAAFADNFKGVGNRTREPPARTPPPP